LRFKLGGLELMQKILGSVIGKTNVGAGKILIEDGSAEESRELLSFYGVARQSQYVAATSKNNTADVAIER
jgi:hypothetical protein